MPAAFDRCVDQGGTVRTVSGPDKDHGLDSGEYVHYCYLGGKSYRGEVRQKKDNEANVSANEGALEGKSYRTLAQILTNEYQVKTLNGREHIVVPAIIIQEGVMHASNAEHPALALAEEFGLFPESWNGRPVVYSHPKRNGSPVSANSPDGWENEVIGQLFGSALSGKKLRTNLWLDREKLPSEVEDTITNNNGSMLEVSTGLYALEEHTEGEFNNKHYDVIWRNINPDHLAILEPGTIGACSVEDGCGVPRANKAASKTGDDEMRINVLSKARNPSYKGTEATPWKAANRNLSAYVEGYNKHNDGELALDASITELPQVVKNWIATRSLLGNPEAETVQELIATPVVNPLTNRLNGDALRSALSGKGFRMGISSDSRESARSKAKALLRHRFNVDDDELQILEERGCACRSDLPGGDPSLLLGSEEMKGVLAALGVGLQDSELSDQDRREAVQAALQEATSGNCYIIAMYSNKVVYMELDTETYQMKLYERGYSVDEGSEVTISSDVTEVRPETQYVPLVVTINEGDQPNPEIPEGADMTTKSQTPNAAGGDKKTAAAPQSQTPGTAAAPEQKPGASAGDAPNVLVGVETPPEPTPEAKSKTVDELMDRATEPVQNELRDAITYVRARREALVRALSGKKGFTDEDLNGMDIRTLEKVAAAVLPAAQVPSTQAPQPAQPAQPASQTADYSGAGGGQPPKAAEEFTQPLKVFPDAPATQQ